MPVSNERIIEAKVDRRDDRRGAAYRLADFAARNPYVCLGLVFIAFVLSIAFEGKVHLDQQHLFIWIIVALLSVSLNELRRVRAGIVFDWIPLFLILYAYSWLRGYADNLTGTAHSFSQIRFDQFILNGHVASVILQSRFFHPESPRWYDYAAMTVYMSHFFVSFIVAGVLWKVNHRQFRRYMTMFVALTFSGFLTFLLYPALPPWLASEQGLLPPTARVVHAMWQYIDVHSVSSMFSPRSHDSNPVAAIPSLHSAYPMLLLAFFWGAGWRARVPLAIYTVSMALTLLYSGEHYLLDVAFGWLYAITIVVVLNRVLRPRVRGEVEPVRQAPVEVLQLQGVE